MKSLKHTSSYGLLVALMLTSMHIDAHSSSFYQKAVDPVVQQTKKAILFCKSKLAAIRKRVEQKTHTQKQLLCIALIGGILLDLSLVLAVNLNAPYTERKLLKALRKNDQEKINDYLDNKRVQPNDLVEGQRLLFWAAKHKSSETVEKLLAMGADPRKQNDDSNSVLEVCHTKKIDPAILILLNAQVGKICSRGDIQCLEIAIKKLRNRPETAPEDLLPELPAEIFQTIREFTAAPPYNVQRYLQPRTQHRYYGS